MDMLYKFFGVNKKKIVSNIVECGKVKCKKEQKDIGNSMRKEYIKCIKNKKKNSKKCFEEVLHSKEVLKSKEKLKKCMKKKCLTKIKK